MSARTRSTLRALRLLAAGMLLASAGWSTAIAGPIAVGGDGTIYKLWTGTFAELYGSNPALPPETQVLALDVTRPGGALQRLVVPGTEGPESESSAALLNDPSADSVHLIWNTRTVGNQAWSRFELRSFSPSGWSEATEISGGTLTEKSHLQGAIINDELGIVLDSVEVRVPRRIVHLVWSESAGDSIHNYYSPVIFVGGKYLGWNPVIALDTLGDDESVSAIVAPAELRAGPQLVGTSGDKTVAVFVHSVTQRLVVAEIQALPGELGQLAEMARGHIVELAAIIPPWNRPALAEMARGHIIELASRFHPAAAAYLGSRTADLILAAPSGSDGATLSEMARGHIVELGREILGSGLQNHCATDGLVLEIPPLAPSEGLNFSHFLAARRAGSLELPADVAPGQRLLTSSRGDLSIIAWESPEQILYREATLSGEWSELRFISLGQVSAAEAWGALERRASGR